MPDPTDGHPEDRRADVGCPECGSARVSFRIQRRGRPRPSMSERSLIWECHDCRTRWSGPLTGHPTNPELKPGDPPW
jgi:DNA-directed RNA polymerase subunit M/transcription elongation factor TFIIS